MDHVKVMLITGGSRGIGAATAVRAAVEGYTVVVNYHRNAQAADTVAQQVVGLGGTAVAIQADVSAEDGILRLFADIDDRFGRIDVLVNNAGILERQAKVEDLGTERLQRIFQTNVVGPMLCAREAIRRMSYNHGGSGGAIVNVSSIAAVTGSPCEYVDYAASKGAIDTFTVGLAKEVAGEGIRVNGVRPAFIDTEIHAAGGEPDRIARLAQKIPMQRGGLASEVAEAIVWLASDKASYSTGTFIDVSGGPFTA